MISLPDMPDIPEMAAVYLAMEWAEQALAHAAAYCTKTQ
jgi:hypothetical protein